MADAVDDEPTEKKGPHRWKPGESGNPAGRPKGSRNKLCEHFYADVLEDWVANGKAAITTFREERPGDYVKVVATLLPKHVEVKLNEVEELSDAEIRAQLNALAREMRASGSDPFAGDEDSPGAGEAQPISPVH